MIKYYCDKCENLIPDIKQKIDIPFHIANKASTGHSALVNGMFHSYSANTVSYDLCLPCANKVFKAAYEEIKNKD